MATFIAWLLALLSFVLPALAHANQLGSSITPPMHYGSNVGYVHGNRWAATATGTIDTINIHLYSGAGNLRLAIFTDNGSGTAPSALLAESILTPAIGSGWQAITIPTVTVTYGVYYWICFQVSSSSCQISGPADSGYNYAYKSYSFGAFPATITGTTGGSAGLSMYSEIIVVPPIMDVTPLIDGMEMLVKSQGYTVMGICACFGSLLALVFLKGWAEKK